MSGIPMSLFGKAHWLKTFLFRLMKRWLTYIQTYNPRHKYTNTQSQTQQKTQVSQPSPTNIPDKSFTSVKAEAFCSLVWASSDWTSLICSSNSEMWRSLLSRSARLPSRSYSSWLMRSSLLRNWKWHCGVYLCTFVVSMTKFVMHHLLTVLYIADKENAHHGDNRAQNITNKAAHKKWLTTQFRWKKLNKYLPLYKSLII